MKKLLILFGLIAICGTVSAQDIITLTNADEINAKVLKVSQTEIEYKKQDNPDGPAYTIPAADVFFIKFENGTKEVITRSYHRTLTMGPGPAFMPGRSSMSAYPKYQGEFSLAYGVGIGEAANYFNTNRIHFETVHGARFTPYLFAGMGAGFTYFYSEYIDSGIIPVFADLKGYYPVTTKISLYMALDLGVAIGATGGAEGTEFYTAVGPGINFGNGKGRTRGDFSIRFQHMGEGLNAMLFRIGISF